MNGRKLAIRSEAAKKRRNKQERADRTWWWIHRQFIHNSWAKASGVYIYFARHLHTSQWLVSIWSLVESQMHTTYSALSFFFRSTACQPFVHSTSIRCVGTQELSTFRRRFRQTSGYKEQWEMSENVRGKNYIHTFSAQLNVGGNVCVICIKCLWFRFRISSSEALLLCGCCYGTCVCGDLSRPFLFVIFSFAQRMNKHWSVDTITPTQPTMKRWAERGYNSRPMRTGVNTIIVNRRMANLMCSHLVESGITLAAHLMTVIAFERQTKAYEADQNMIATCKFTGKQFKAPRAWKSFNCFSNSTVLTLSNQLKRRWLRIIFAGLPSQFNTRIENSVERNLKHENRQNRCQFSRYLSSRQTVSTQSKPQILRT